MAMERELVTSDRFARARRKSGIMMIVKRQFRFNSPVHGTRIFVPGSYLLDLGDEKHLDMLAHPFISRDKADGCIETLADGEGTRANVIAAKASEMWNNAARGLARRGIPPDQYLQMTGKTQEELVEDAKPDAEKALRREAVQRAGRGQQVQVFARPVDAIAQQHFLGQAAHDERGRCQSCQLL